MNTKFNIADKVSWNSEAGRVSGTIIKIHTKDSTTKVISTMLPNRSLNTKSKAIRPITSRHTKVQRSQKSNTGNSLPITNY